MPKPCASPAVPAHVFAGERACPGGRGRGAACSVPTRAPGLSCASQNSYAGVLPPGTSNATVCGGMSFKEAVKVKRGHWGGPESPVTVSS